MSRRRCYDCPVQAPRQTAQSHSMRPLRLLDTKKPPTRRWSTLRRLLNALRDPKAQPETSRNHPTIRRLIPTLLMAIILMAVFRLSLRLLDPPIRMTVLHTMVSQMAVSQMAVYKPPLFHTAVLHTEIPHKAISHTAVFHNANPMATIQIQRLLQPDQQLQNRRIGRKFPIRTVCCLLATHASPRPGPIPANRLRLIRKPKSPLRSPPWNAGAALD